jgi:hypothetical protein
LRFLVSASVAFVFLCYGSLRMLSIQRIQRLGIQLNVGLIVLAMGLLAAWFGVHSYSPPVSISGHWGMVLVSLVGFLSMLLSAVAALKHVTGVRSGLIAAISVGMGLVHLLNAIVSLPVS